MLVVDYYRKAKTEDREPASSLNVVLWDKHDYRRLTKVRKFTQAYRDLLLIEVGLTNTDPLLDRLVKAVPSMVTYKPYDILETLVGIWLIIGVLVILTRNLNPSTLNIGLLGLMVLSVFHSRASKKREEIIEYVTLSIIRRLTPIRGGISTPELAYVTKLGVEDVEKAVKSLLGKNLVNHSNGKWRAA